MPTNGNRALSAFAGLSLFMTSILCCYLLSTTSNPVLSLIYVGGIVVLGLSAAARWSVAFEVQSRAVKWADRFTTWVPFVAIVACVLQGVKYNADGAEGLWAGFAILSGTFLVVFGLTDSISALFGKKYREFADAAHEAANRASAARDALSGRH